MNYNTFKQGSTLSMERICRAIYQQHGDTIKVKKEAVAVRNLITILNTVLDFSIRTSFDAMSLRDLSKASGLSMGALYSYFSSKNELLDMIQTQGREIGVGIIEAAIANDADPASKLRTAVRYHLYLSEMMQKWFYFSYMESKNLNRTAQKKSIQAELYTEQIFIDILEEGAACGRFRLIHATLTASIIKAMLQDWYLKRWKYKRRNITVDQYADFVIDFIDAAILAV